MINGIIFSLLIPFLGTTLGAAFVFLLHDKIAAKVQNTLLGFASGVMVAAAVWSLLIPAMDMNIDMGKWRIVPAAAGLLSGMAFLLMIDMLTPHLHLGDNHPEGMKSKLSRTTMLALAVTIHNLPEGMAVGIVIAGALQANSEISIAATVAMAIGIAIQNIPEGAVVSIPMRAEGNSRRKAFAIGTLSGIVEPIGALLVILLVSVLSPILPFLLCFAAGSMLYVVVEELIPEASSGEHSNTSTLGFAIGFTLMMILDVTLS